MKSSNCYLPTWTSDGKLVKRGSYCNWEAVLSHAKHICAEQEHLSLDAIKDHISGQTGGEVCFNDVHFSDLDHFNVDGSKELDAQAYHNACCYMTNEVFVVKINEAGHSFELLLDTNDGKLDFGAQIKRPPLIDEKATPSQILAYRKGKLKDKDLCVLYWPGKNGCDQNIYASNLFKMQIYGEVLLVQCSKESSFLPRERYVSYTLMDFEENYVRKRKRVAPEQTSLRPDEYDAIKVEMQASLSSYEKQASSLAQNPRKSAKVNRMPPPDGRQLAQLVREKAAQESSVHN